VTSPAGHDHDTPAVVGDERVTQLAFLGYLRAAVDRKLVGLSEDDARRSLVASRTTLLGIVKHLTYVEAYWGQRRLTGVEITETFDGFDLDPDDMVASVRRRYAEAARRTDDAVNAGGALDMPLARGRRGLTVRWMLTHLIEETARHAGHADILRELVDGAGGR
jgi:uncharacterized damage-inducible protein DinB